MIKKNNRALLMLLFLSFTASLVQAEVVDPLDAIKIEIRQGLKANTRHRKIIMGAAACGIGLGGLYLFNPLSEQPKVLSEAEKKIKLESLKSEQRVAIVDGLLKKELDRNNRTLGGVRDFVWNWGVIPGVTAFFSTPFVKLSLKGYALCEENYDKIFHDADLRWYNATHARVIQVQQASAFAFMDLFRGDESAKTEADKPQPESNGLFALLEKNIDSKEEFEATWRDGYRNVQSIIAFMEIKVEDNPEIASFKIHKEAAQHALDSFVTELAQGNGQQAFKALRENFTKSFKRFCSAERQFSL